MTQTDIQPVPQVQPAPVDDPAIPANTKDQVVLNRARTAIQWNETAHDMALNNVVNEHDRVRRTWWETLVLTVVVLLMAAFGAVWTYNSFVRDRMVADQRAAAESRPYAPQSVMPVK